MNNCAQNVIQPSQFSVTLTAAFCLCSECATTCLFRRVSLKDYDGQTSKMYADQNEQYTSSKKF
jgi:hypothetical protein